MTAKFKSAKSTVKEQYAFKSHLTWLAARDVKSGNRHVRYETLRRYDAMILTCARELTSKKSR